MGLRALAWWVDDPANCESCRGLTLTLPTSTAIWSYGPEWCDSSLQFKASSR